MTRSDNDMKAQLVKEFEQLVLSIIFINRKTQDAFKGANTIEVREYIGSLIKSTDITSEIPAALRTQSLKIIRKVIESENKNSTASALDWEIEQWKPFAMQIRDAQDMLVKMDLIKLLCSIISKEQRKEIKEEAMMVAIAVLIGGNEGA